MLRSHPAGSIADVARPDADRGSRPPEDPGAAHAYCATDAAKSAANGTCDHTSVGGTELVIAGRNDPTRAALPAIRATRSLGIARSGGGYLNRWLPAQLRGRRRWRRREDAGPRQRR